MYLYYDIIGWCTLEVAVLSVICDRCGRAYQDLFDTVVRMDYVETGRGKPYEMHLCVDCRKQLIDWMKMDG